MFNFPIQRKTKQQDAPVGPMAQQGQAGKSMMPPAFQMQAGPAASPAQSGPASKPTEQKEWKYKRPGLMGKGMELNKENLWGVLNMFPSGRAAIAMFEKWTYSLSFVEGRQAYCSASEIAIGTGYTLEEAATTFIHEVGHMWYLYEGEAETIDGQKTSADTSALHCSLADYIDGAVREDANVEVRSYEAIPEMKEAGISTRKLKQDKAYLIYHNAYKAAKREGRKAKLKGADLDAYARKAGLEALVYEYKYGKLEQSTDHQSYMNGAMEDYEKAHPGLTVEEMSKIQSEDNSCKDSNKKPIHPVPVTK